MPSFLAHYLKISLLVSVGVNSVVAPTLTRSITQTQFICEVPLSLFDASFNMVSTMTWAEICSQKSLYFSSFRSRMKQVGKSA